jgi:uncharacterized protein YdeI (YjbR/CyaY-like superfamily)
MSNKTEKKVWHSNELWEVELELLRSIINKTQLVATTKWGGEVYTHNNKNVIGIGGSKNFFVIWFFNGVFLKDELNVLVNANEGVTKGLRQWRFTSKEEIIEKQVLAYIKEAIANEEKGLSIKPEKKVIVPSDYFNGELKSDSRFAEAFQQFSPFKQKEFIEYVDSAKQEKTKITRMEKIKPMVLSGVGLNDKYRS